MPFWAFKGPGATLANLGANLQHCTYKSSCPPSQRCIAFRLCKSLMSDTTGRLIAAFCFLALVINIPPFIYHCSNRNIPACSLIFWLCYNNLTGFVNALIWSGADFDLATEAKGYCDLTVRITSGASSGKICAVACLMMNLFLIIDARNHKFLAPRSKRRIFLNIIMCWATPVCIMGTSMIVQTSRYVIVKYRGCVAPHGSNYVSVLLVKMWPLIWSFVALVFAVLTLWTYVQKRRDIKDLLRCTNSGLTLKRFARLLIFSLLVMFIMCPFAIYEFVADMENYNGSSFSFSQTHDEWWALIYKVDASTLGVATRIVDIGLSFITLLLFGLGSDALDMYRSWLVRIGFKRFSKPLPDELFVSKEFTDSRKGSRGTEDTERTAQSDDTVETMFEYSKFKELVFPEKQTSVHLATTLTKTGTICIENGFEDADLEDQLGNGSGNSLEIRFDFNVRHH